LLHTETNVYVREILKEDIKTEERKKKNRERIEDRQVREMTQVCLTTT